MDFVVVGLGLGTAALLTGVLLLGWLAGRRERAAGRATVADEAAHDYAMASWRRDFGQALLGAGSAVLLATVGALAGSLSDQTGAFLVTTTATVAALGLLFWAYLYRARHPIPPRQRSRAAAPARPAMSQPPASRLLPPARPADRPGVAASQPGGDDTGDTLPAATAPAPDEDVPGDPAPDLRQHMSSGEPHPVATEGHEAVTERPPEEPGDTNEEQPVANGAAAAPEIIDLVAFAARSSAKRASPGEDDEGTS